MIINSQFIKYYILSLLLTPSLFSINIELSCNPLNKMNQADFYHASISCSDESIIVTDLSENTLQVTSIDNIHSIINFAYEDNELLRIKFEKDFATIYMTKYIICNIDVLTEQDYLVKLVMLKTK